VRSNGSGCVRLGNPHLHRPLGGRIRQRRRWRTLAASAATGEQRSNPEERN